MGYGDMEVTSMAQQEGTGEKFPQMSTIAGLTFSRKIVQWFSFGATPVFHQKFGTLQPVPLLLMLVLCEYRISPTGKKDGMRIGMSISNYGTRMKYDGIDLNPIDISPFEDGNFADVLVNSGHGWELPLFRIGIGIKPIYSEAPANPCDDAIHPNNNSEYLNVGGQYELRLAGQSLYLRSGYKSLFMTDSQFGATYGGGIKINLKSFS